LIHVKKHLCTSMKNARMLWESPSLLAPASATHSPQVEDSPAHAALILLDDPRQWPLFGRLTVEPGGPSADAGLTWASQVAILGMHCATCALNIEQTLLAQPGVLLARVDAHSQRAEVVWRSDQTLPSRWMGAVAQAGYQFLPAHDGGRRALREKQSRQALWQWLVAGFCMMQVMMYSVPVYVADPGDISPDMLALLHWAGWVLSLPVMVFSSGPFWRQALSDVRQGRMGMDMPVVLGLGITFVVSTAATWDPTGPWGSEVYFDSLTMFVFFLLTGRWLEGRMRDRTAGALDALMNRLPEQVQRFNAQGQLETVAASVLQVGDTVRIGPGQAFPADARVVQGSTWVEEALLTGESKPLARHVNDRVLSGSHNLRQTVDVVVTAVGDATVYAQTVALMASAALSKPRLARLADRLAKPFLWFVLIAAFGAAAWAWPVNPGHALMVAVSVLIVTCPCALSLATPAAMLAAAGNLARHGVLIRDLQSLQALAEVDMVVWDKTGTLTTDAQSVLRIHTPQGAGVPDAQGQWSTESLTAWSLAAALAQHSLHPMSRALDTLGGAHWPTRSVSEHPGLGLQGDVWCAGQWQRCVLGSWSFGQTQMHSSPGAQDQAHAPQPMEAGVHLWGEAGWLASFEVSETLRTDAAQALRRLEAMGLQIQVLSGDRHSAVAALAQRLGLRPDQVQGGMNPQAKLDQLRAWQAQGHRVAVVGDGFNDMPVLAAAHASIAVGQAVPLARAHSDAVVRGECLWPVVQALGLARRTMVVVRHNLWWAALYNAVCIPLAVLGWMPAWLAGAGMALSSLAVVLNALQLAHDRALLPVD
jgi:Cu2+-exporting ATPase